MAITRGVYGQGYSTSYATDVVATLSGNVTTGSCLFVVAATPSDASLPTLSDPMYNTYSLIDSWTDGSHGCVGVYLASNVTGGFNTITCTGPSTYFHGLIAVEYKNVPTSAIVDVHSVASAFYSTTVPRTWPCPATGTLAQADEVVLGVAYNAYGCSDWTADSPFAAIGEAGAYATYPASSGYTIFLEEQIVSSRASVTPAPTSVALPSAYTQSLGAAFTVTLKGSGGGGGGSTYNDSLPTVGSPNSFKLTCASSLAQSLSAANALSFNVTNNFALTQQASLATSLAAFNVTNNFAATALNTISQSPSYSLTLNQTITTLLTAANTISTPLTTNFSMTQNAVFPRALSFPLTLGYTALLGYSDSLTYSVTLSQALSTQKTTLATFSALLNCQMTLSSSRMTGAALSELLTLQQSLQTSKQTSVTFSSTVQFGMTALGVVPNTSEHTMTASFFGFVPIMSATSFTSAASLSATDLETDVVMSADDFEGDVQ